jgi:hypothetical protein
MTTHYMPTERAAFQISMEDHTKSLSGNVRRLLKI